MTDLQATDIDAHYAVAHEGDGDGDGKGRLTYHWSIEEAIYRVDYERIN